MLAFRSLVVLALLATSAIAATPKALKKADGKEPKGMKVTHISNKDLPEEPLRMGRASGELLHKLSWALPGALPKELIRKMERFGYDSEAAHKTPGKYVGPQGSSFLETGEASQMSVYKKEHVVTRQEVEDAKYALKMFVLSKARQFGDAQKLEEGAKILNAVGKLVTRAEKHMIEKGYLVVSDDLKN